MKTVAVLGASPDRNKFGNKAVRAYRQKGYIVYPVNPKHTQIEGLACYPSVRDVPRRPDIVSVYLQPYILKTLLSDIAARDCDELWLNPGTEAKDVMQEAENLGLNVITACSIVGLGLSPADF